MTKTVHFKVGMTCGGCSGAVQRILGKIEGVESVNANLDTKDVTVVTSDDVDKQVLLDALLKWSTASKKSVELIN